MIAFTVLGFMIEGGKYFNFNRDVFAESPTDAMEKAVRQHANWLCRPYAGPPREGSSITDRAAGHWL